MTARQTELTKPGLVKKTEELSDKRVASRVRAREERAESRCVFWIGGDGEKQGSLPI
jgi:hypothetical protein